MGARWAPGVGTVSDPIDPRVLADSPEIAVRSSVLKRVPRRRRRSGSAPRWANPASSQPSAWPGAGASFGAKREMDGAMPQKPKIMEVLRELVNSWRILRFSVMMFRFGRFYRRCLKPKLLGTGASLLVAKGITGSSSSLQVAKGISNITTSTSNIRLAYLAKSTMAAPSVTWLLLPAVVLPPALKALVGPSAETATGPVTVELQSCRAP